jgi:uncharacterized protein YlxW (UPF0749 family)
LAAFLVVLAAEQAHVRAPAAARSRTALVAQVQRQSQAVTALTAQVDELRAATGRLRDLTLGGSAAGAALAAQVRAQERAGGLVAVVGPGLRVTLNDAAATSGAGQRNRVLDRDLQSVVNALWAAGAEAIAVNGQRLSEQSSIREAGEAVLVNFQPLKPPYLVDAVGDPVRMETSFAQSAAADRMRSYQQLYGLHFGYAREQHLGLPAAAEEPLHSAHPLATPSRSGP